MNALAPYTQLVFEGITKLSCIKPWVLVGGTALSLQLNSRLSEDLDFMNWINLPGQKPEVNWVQIEKELFKIGNVEEREIWDFDHVEFVVNKVKISFYASDKFSPVKNPVHFKNNLTLADLSAIAALKLDVMLRRSNFKDYYDIYSLLLNGVDLKSSIELARRYSGKILKTRNILYMLLDSKRFKYDQSFGLLNPVYNVSADDIGLYLKDKIATDFKPDL